MLATRTAAAVAETVWATRCIICDKPGMVLCGACRQRLPYIDRWHACPHCGAAHGWLVCTDCNTFSLQDIGRDKLPFERCVCALEHRGRARSIVTGYKDAGERRLADDMARILWQALPRSWLREGVLSFIPADKRARRRRGFDHMEPIAQRMGELAGMPCLHLLEKEAVADQRGLTRKERIHNMRQSIRLAAGQGGKGTPETVIVIDDVYTTGATLFAACDALAAAGVAHIRCATFARVG